MNYLMIFESSFLFIFGFGALALGALSLLKTKLRWQSIVLSSAGIVAIVILFLRWAEVAEFWELMRIAVLIVGGGAVASGILGVCALLIHTRSR